MSLFCNSSKSALHYDVTLIEQSQMASDSLRAVQIVSYHNGCHVMFLLELEDQIIDLAGTDRVETGGRLVEQQEYLAPKLARVPAPLVSACHPEMSDGIFAARFPFPLPPGVRSLGLPSSDFDSFLVVLQRKSHVLFDGQRVVKRGVLKQKAHLPSDLAQLVESQAGDFLAMNKNRA